MAHILNPERVMVALKDGTVEQIKGMFPIVGKKNTLVAKDIYAGTETDIDDINSQRRARLLGRTWSVGIYGDFDLVDNTTGKKVDSKKIKLVNLPQITRRYSYIVDGTEYQVDNQWRLKSGVYTRKRADGDLETQFNLVKGRGFRMLFDPIKKSFTLRYDTSNISLPPILKALGVSDDKIKQAWGEEIYNQSQKRSTKKDLMKLAKSLDRYTKVTTEEEAAGVIRQKLGDTVLLPDTTRITLGKAYNKVDGSSLLAASGKLLSVHRGESKVDSRDALQFKELWTVKDFIPERIKNSEKRIQRKINNNIDRKSSVRSVISPDIFNLPVKAFFTSTNLAQLPSQTNPMDMISGHMRTTLLGTGGISTPNAVSFDAKLIDQSHLGFLDPVATPEGPRSGITLHLGLGVEQHGKEAVIPVYSTKLGKTVKRSPVELASSVIAFPDQYSWNKGKPTPKDKNVTVSKPGAPDPRIMSSSEVDYIITSPKGMFSFTTNMIPFLSSDQANRAEMATRHIEQSISLKNREQPLVQTHTGSQKKDESWEAVVGKFSAHKARVNGTVTSIDKKNITVTDSRGKPHKIQLYDSYPLNDKKTFITSTPIVKVGDKVSKEDIIADTNFTKDGVLSLGTNLRVAYLPYKGFVFEDGIVISESASEKLTSEHLYKERKYVDKNMMTGLRKFRAHYPAAVSDENAQKLDEDGVVKPGQIIHPGEVITTVLQKTEPSKEQLMLKGIHRSLLKPYKDKGVRWEKAVPGVVTDVVKNGREITVYMRTEEKASIGDKLSGRHGNKGVICYCNQTEILTSDGWKFFEDLRNYPDLSVCTFNPATNNIEYHVPNEHFKLPYTGKMYKYEGRRLNTVTTPNHRHYTRTRRGKYRFESPDIFAGLPRIMKRGGADWEGTELASVIIPGVDKPGYEQDLVLSGDTFMRFFGYWVTEGCLGDSNKVFVSQKKEVNPETYAKIHVCLQELGLDTTIYTYPNTLGFSDARLHQYLQKFGKCADKFIPRNLLTASKRQLQLLWDSCIEGDGGIYFCEKDNHTREELFTNSKKLADDYQELALKLGHSANIKPQHRTKVYTLVDGTEKVHETTEYIVRLSRKDEVWINNDKRYDNESWVDYDDFIYCVAATNHILYIRRKGIPVWSGNTQVVPDEEMPQDKDGKPIEIIMNPSGVPGRINAGQVLETKLGEVAHQTQTNYSVNNFESDDQKKLIKVGGHYRTVNTKEGPKSVYIEPYEYERGYNDMVQDEMRKNNVSSEVELIDPTTGKSLGEVLVGRQYVLKLMHQVDKKLSARAHGYGTEYDSSLVPKGGGKAAAQKFGGLGLYAMLAHGSTANIRDGLTFKCFLYHHKVITDQGELEIGKIVHNELPVKVLSVDSKGGLCWKHIKHFWKRPIENEQLVKVSSYRGYNDGSFQKSSAVCTAGHEYITTNRGKVKAGELRCGKDFLHTQGAELTQRHYDLLLGSLMGDGYMSLRDHHQFPYFQERHSIKQREYLQFKADALAHISNRELHQYTAGFAGFNNGQEMVEWSSRAHPGFTKLHKLFYSEGFKRFGWALEVLTLPALAIWFQDDGFGFIPTGQNNVQVGISTCSMTSEELLQAVEKIVELTGVEFNVTSDGYLKKYGTEAVKFLETIAPYAHPSMAYKFCGNGEVGSKINEFLEKGIGLVEVPVVDIEVVSTKTLSKWRGKYLFNLEVEDTHNYFVSGINVGNSDKSQDEVWTAIQSGNILPAPRPSFVYSKFIAYLNALGVNVEKEGNGLVLTPLTDKETLALSNGELTQPSRVLRGKDLKPEEGGLFDEQVTGGPGGDKWGHIELTDPLPNPMFAKAIQTLLGLKQKEFEGIVRGVQGFDKNGDVVAAEEAVSSGPTALANRLKGYDVEGNLAKAKEKLPNARANEFNQLYKTVKYLSALDKVGMSPEEAYTLKNLPVLPPIFRPVTVMEGGDLNIDGLNMLYRDVALINDKLDQAKTVLPDKQLAVPRADLYDALKALMATGTVSQEGALTSDGQVRPPGVLTLIAGTSSPKFGFFQEKVVDRKQDLTLRSVITPDLSLHLDEVGLPRKGAMQIYRPFVVKELVRMGYTPLSAKEEIEKDSNLANKALDVVSSKRPILLKRDPVLHKFGIMAFKPRLHNKSAIHIHPLLVGGYNADFDGDAMGVFVPVSNEAVEEAHKMLPSKNLFSPASGRAMYQPSLEGQLGLFLLTQMGKDTGKSFSSLSAALQAGKKGDVPMTGKITADGKKTTPGRIAFYNAIPSKVRTDAILTDPAMVMDGKNMQGILKSIAKQSPQEFQGAADRFKDLGFGYAYNIGFSFKEKDFNALRAVREKHLAIAKAKVDALPAKTTTAEKDAFIIKAYTKATADMKRDGIKQMAKEGNSLYAMHKAGVKPGWVQLQQLVLAPMLLDNARNETIPVPVTRSYSEGIDSAGYWVASSGARKGLIEKVQSVSVPGALSKQIMNTVMGYVVTDDDCGTDKGISLNTVDTDVVDRYLAKGVRLNKGRNVAAGTLLTPTLVSDIKASKISKVVVRSPLKCKMPKGLCGKCYGDMDEGGLPNKGTNLGAIAGQAIGERGTQLAMKTFHTGGVAGASGAVVGSLDRITQLLKLPAKLPNSAILTPVSGTVSDIKKSAAGGWDVSVGKTEVYVPASRELAVKVGDTKKRGDVLSNGSINPKELLALTNIDTVQRYIADSIHGVYASEGIKRRNVEVVTKALTNLGVVDDPGDADGIIKGDFISLSYADSLSSNLKNPVKTTPVLRGVETLALDQTTDWLARLQYRKLKETLTRGASEGWSSDIHGLHPIPGVVYGAEFGKPTKDVKGPY